ncbi:MAG TPA: alpha/beta fold hydrolase [Acidimicrobiales bacterium]|nr:alpha/beta fold hydrolase [Acidimicrobiales bacterium]HVC25510.1 alpha/beta fold hydrolase [Acidimicrobiales bacterium]
MSLGAPAPGGRGRRDLHVETSEHADHAAPAVVLVHGVLDSGRSFSRLRRVLAGRHPTVAYDRRGYQRSRVAGAACGLLADHVDDLLWILEEHAPAIAAHASPCGARRAVVLGHSYGGVVALTAASRRPDLVGAVVAYEPPLSWLPFWSAPAGAGAPVPPAPETGEAPAAFAERFTRSMLGDERYARLAPATRAGIALDGAAAAGEIAELPTAAAFDASAIDVTVVAARGSDAAVRHVLGAEWLAGAVRGATLAVVAGAGHGAHITHPNELAVLVEEACREVARHDRLGRGRGADGRP